MNWKHIMDCQPDHDRSIIQCEGPASDGHYYIGMRNYSLIGTWQEFITWLKNNDLDYPDFWWIYTEDFPFPNKDKITQIEWIIYTIEHMRVMGWVKDREDEEHLGFSFIEGDAKWIRDYDKRTRRFVQYNANTIINIRMTNESKHH